MSPWGNNTSFKKDEICATLSDSIKELPALPLGGLFFVADSASVCGEVASGKVQAGQVESL